MPLSGSHAWPYQINLSSLSPEEGKMASAGIMKVDEKPSLQPVPLLDLRAQYRAIREEVRAASDRVADSQQFILGPEVEALEEGVADYSQCAFAIGVASGSGALLVELRR